MARTTAKPKEPVKMTPELEDEICDVVSTSPYMLEELCRENPHWPSARIIYRERIFNENFGKKYTRAKQSQIEVLVERIFLLSRDKKDCYLVDKDGIDFADQVAMTNKRHEIDSIKWLASKLAPKIYGDKKEDNKKDTDDFVSRHRDEIDNG